MELLAGEVLIEAISKVATSSHFKLFLLMEDSSSNRSYAGSESLCAAFVDGSLKWEETDTKVDYDVNERRCVKRAGQATGTGGEAGDNVSAAAAAETLAVKNETEDVIVRSERIMTSKDFVKKETTPEGEETRTTAGAATAAVVNETGAVGGIGSENIEPSKANIKTEASPHSESLLPERKDARARSKRRISTGNDYDGEKRIKTEPKSRSPSPSASPSDVSLGK